MQPLVKRITIAAGALVLSGNLLGFSLQGPLADWMTERLGYNRFGPAHYGGPMVLGEEYRWNVPQVYYGFTPEFIHFFGARGIAEVDQAFAKLNALPPASKMQPESFPLTSQRVNHRAQALGITDLRSHVLSLAVEQLGLCDPTRYVYTLRNRWTTSDPDTTNFFVIRRNYDPVTWQNTSFINGVLWTYPLVFDIDEAASLAFTQPVDPLAYQGYLNMPVAGGGGNLLPGGFWTSLTYDDIGGLRYLYRPENYNTETYVASVSGSGGGAWGQPPGVITNGLGTNFVNTALRPGRDRITFQRVNFDSLIGGFFLPITNTFNDTFITNSQAFPQQMQRVLVAPDILFHVADLQGGDGDDAIFGQALAFQEWIYGNTPVDGEVGGPIVVGNLGPGVIGPGDGGPAFTVTFNGVGEILWNTYPFDNMDEVSASRFLLWGSFDGTTNAPVVYPVGLEITDIERMVLSSGTVGNPWGAPPGTILDPVDGGGGGGGDFGGGL